MTVPARWGGLGRGPDDRYWSTWWIAAGLAVLTMTTAAWLQPDGWSEPEAWFLVAGFGFLTVAAALGPLTARQRPPVVAGVAALTWVSATGLLDATALAVTAPIAVAGWPSSSPRTRATPLTTPRPERAAPADAASLGLTGTPSASSPSPSPWCPGGPRSVAVATSRPPASPSPAGSTPATAPPWAPLLARARSGRPVDPAVRHRCRHPGHARARPRPCRRRADRRPALGVRRRRDRRGLCRAQPPRRCPDRVVTVARVERLPRRHGGGGRLPTRTRGTLAGLVAIPVTTALLRRERRARVMTWVSWAVAAPIAGLFAAETWAWFDAQPDERAVAFTLASVGSVLLVGAAAADLRGRAWAPRLLPTHPWALPPAVVGAADVLAGRARRNGPAAGGRVGVGVRHRRGDRARDGRAVAGRCSRRGGRGARLGRRAPVGGARDRGPALDRRAGGAGAARRRRAAVGLVRGSAVVGEVGRPAAPVGRARCVDGPCRGRRNTFCCTDLRGRGGRVPGRGELAATASGRRPSRRDRRNRPRAGRCRYGRARLAGPGAPRALGGSHRDGRARPGRPTDRAAGGRGDLGGGRMAPGQQRLGPVRPAGRRGRRDRGGRARGRGGRRGDRHPARALLGARLGRHRGRRRGGLRIRRRGPRRPLAGGHAPELAGRRRTGRRRGGAPRGPEAAARRMAARPRRGLRPRCAPRRDAGG